MIKSFFVGNLRVKFLAMAMAVALWFFAINRYTEEITEVIDVEVTIPPEFTLLSQSTNNVIIKLNGPQELIDEISGMISDNQIKARFQISANDIGELNDTLNKSVPISIENFNLPHDIKLVSVFPGSIDIELSRLEKKYLKVRLQKQGKPAQGFSLENEFVYPSEVEVTGPSNILKTLSEIETVPIDIAGITSEKNKTFPWIIGIDQNVRIAGEEETRFISIKCDEKVRVWFSISELQEVKTLSKIKVTVLLSTNFPYKVTLEEEIVDIVVTGPKLLVDNLASENIVAYVDVRLLLPPGPYKQPIFFDLPHGVVVRDQVPEILVDLQEIKTEIEIKSE